MRVIIDGIEVPPDTASVSVYDWAVQRGFGVFEVIRSYDGVGFRTGPHLDRLEKSAAALAIGLPDRGDLEAWVAQAAAAGGDCQIRIVVTGGGRDPLVDAPSRTIVGWEPLPETPDRLRVDPMIAYWHPGEAAGPLYGVKWLSYAPNMASTDIARRRGYHDALLLSRDGWVLEGPTFTVAWFVDGVLETPSLDLGILASITRAVLFEIGDAVGIPVVEGRYPLERLLAADEVVGMSTIKEVSPLGTVGDVELSTGPIAGRLHAAFRDIVEAETGG